MEDTMRKAQRGFTVIELAIVAAVIALLATIAVAVTADVASGARTAKARSDVRELATAVFMYSSQVGSMPSSLDDLATVATDRRRQAVGPFIVLPAAPRGWTPYTYTRDGDVFNIAATGDGVTVSAP
jgi:prepilin-type N-terminal cleavage/methylation domain-containing protein